MEATIIADKQLEKEVRSNLEMIIMENTWLLKQMDFKEVATLVMTIKAANRVFLIAAGRSGFAMRSAAMRFMHLGLNAHFVGETTTPAIQEGDLLLAASGSGTTSSIVRAAEKARSVGATVVALSTQTQSSLSSIADQLILIPAAEKEDHEGSRSRQYAGSLFEQFLLLLTDAIFQSLWKMEDTPNAELWKRHANLE
ncbi:6-phospho-3-hexuloisomerase [Pedobacter gandavensis]|uniref:6-phospho-3-hexuloisomerase n=1 Tax=Pedobacter gandavensis TaxID=2679963 RepID=UPI00292F71D7|nr:6-phospho-3-hexuloisomerase [Pedobacter gandavensis]